MSFSARPSLRMSTHWIQPVPVTLLMISTIVMASLADTDNTRVFHLEPPNCTHNATLEPGEEIILESSNRSSIYNQYGECSIQIWNKDTSKHLLYLFELGK